MNEKSPQPAPNVLKAASPRRPKITEKVNIVPTCKTKPGFPKMSQKAQKASRGPKDPKRPTSSQDYQKYPQRLKCPQSLNAKRDKNHTEDPRCAERPNQDNTRL